MLVKLARTAGFCMGVKRAVDMVLDIARRKGKENIYTYGPLIHNPQTIELLRKRGIIPVAHLDEIQEKGATIIIRAHGISPQEREKIRGKGLRIIDATCPKVGHVQAIIKKHALLDYAVLIVGDGEHPEVNGLLGYTYGRGIVVGGENEVDRLPALDRVCVVAQTTQSLDEYNVIINMVKEKFHDAVVFDTICNSTEQRQAEVKELAAEMEAMVIVGGKNSANTKRLARLSELTEKPTFHIETADELKRVTMGSYERIGVSAGASTPNWIIDRVVDSIKSYQGQKRKKIKGLLNLWVFTIRCDIYSAVGAGCLAFTGMLLQKINVSILNILTTSLYVYAMHTLNRFINRKTGNSIIGSFREELYLKHEKPYLFTALLALCLAMLSSFLMGPAPFVLLLLISALGVLYNTRLFPENWRLKRLRDLPGSKNVSMAMAWGTVATVMPRMEISPVISPGMIVAFLFVFTMVFIRSAMSDTLDIQSDRLIGRETIPVLIGKEYTQSLLRGISVFLVILLIIAYPAGWATSLSLAILSCPFYLWICFKLCDRRSQLSGVIMEGLLETCYFVAGLSAFLWIIVTRYAT
ncbi:MAG: 4-hydroxy-3-methylbut-2-enyl diphosphate reductase [Syntrophales bacterium]|nr:4-hydroxy-3-methylbut-2-enyl diphosphate reductase [Syntrophales bacterium]